MTQEKHERSDARRNREAVIEAAMADPPLRPDGEHGDDRRALGARAHDRLPPLPGP